MRYNIDSKQDHPRDIRSNQMNDTIIRVLKEEKCGKLWEKGNMRRVYFDPTLVLDMDISYYKTGSISSATIAGERISNSEAYRCKMAKFYFDIAKDKFVANGMDRLHNQSIRAANRWLAETSALIDKPQETW